jgi:GTP cyclohydrolase I
LTIHTAIAVPSHIKPSREEAEAAFRTIIRWAGDDPDRSGLLETPARAFRGYFAGYEQDPLAILNKTWAANLANPSKGTQLFASASAISRLRTTNFS